MSSVKYLRPRKYLRPKKCSNSSRLHPEAASSDSVRKKIKMANAKETDERKCSYGSRLDPEAETSVSARKKIKMANAKETEGKCRGSRLPRPGLEAETLESLLRPVAGGGNARVITAAVATATRTRKRSKRYHHYEPEMKAKIGRYAAENGNSAAISEFSRNLGFEIHESTVRNFKRVYYNQRSAMKDTEAITGLELSKHKREVILKLLTISYFSFSVNLIAAKYL